LIEPTRPVFYQIALPKVHFSRGPPARSC
jgi:hypothetical protein